MTPNQDRDDETLLLDDHDAEMAMLVSRRPYDEFCDLMDKHLSDLVSQWTHLAAPNASHIDRSSRRRAP